MKVKKDNKMIFQHKTLEERWGQMSLSQQMGNIGSEVSRAAFWYLKKIKNILLILFQEF
jgi:hypothetical protein